MNKTYVVGDIHGNYKALKQVLQRSNFNKEEDTLISLGDICDGWNEVYECVEELLTIKNLIVLLGNHDKVFIDWLNTGKHHWDWLQGAKGTAESYIKHAERVCKLTSSIRAYYTNLTKFDIPDTHIEFFNKMHLKYIDDKNRLFVHGGFNRHENISGQSEQVLIWDRDLWMAAMSCESVKRGNTNVKFNMKDNFKEVFIGHTTTMIWKKDTPMQAMNIHNLDTGAGFKGKLTIMDINTKEYFQSDEASGLYPGYKGRN